MKTFVFNNTNSSIALICLKALHKYAESESEFYVVFDREYDILVNDKIVSRYFYTLDDRHIYDNVLSKNQCVLLDFDLDFNLHTATSYTDYICEKMGIDEKNFEPLDVFTTTEQAVKIKNLLVESDKNNFSNVLFAPFNLDTPYDRFQTIGDTLYDTTLSSFNPIVADQLLEFLDKKVNVVKILPHEKNQLNISELYFLIKNVDYVISNLDVLHIISHDLKKPSFLNLARFTKYYSKSNTCTIYDPQRNVKKALPSRSFTKNYEHVLGFNNQVLTENFNEIKMELLKSLDKHKIAYK